MKLILRFMIVIDCISRLELLITLKKFLELFKQFFITNFINLQKSQKKKVFKTNIEVQ